MRPVKCEHCGKTYNPKFRTDECTHEAKPQAVKAVKAFFDKRAMNEAFGTVQLKG